MKIEHKEPYLLVVLANSYFRVPKFQRTFVWEQPQVLDFVGDLWDAFSQQTSWFVGTIIVAKGQRLGRLGASLDLIDGQQRLTSLLLWLAALRDHCSRRDIKQWAMFIDDTYLVDKSPMAPPGGQPRLVIGDDEIDRYFKSIVGDGRAKRAPIYGSEERLQSAYDAFKADIEQRVGSLEHGAAESQVADILAWLRESLHAVFAVAPDLGNASRVFDLMNSRGRPLQDSDLLKSHLFAVTDGDAAPEWGAVSKLFDFRASAARFTPTIDSLIRHRWWASHQIDKKTRGAPTYRATHDAIRRETGTRAAALEYVAGLRSDADVYLQLANPTQNYWEQRAGKGVFEALLDLNRLKVEAFRPLILSALNQFAADELKTFLSSLTSWAFRKKVVTGKLGSGEDEAAYFSAAYDVGTGLATSTREVLQRLDIPDDLRFTAQFQNLEIEDRMARWVLGRLEDQSSSLGEKATRWDQMTLEHILPKRLARPHEWTAFTAESHRALRQNIGNLALLGNDPNERAGNGAFLTKLPAYKASSLATTAELASFTEWTPAQITDRAKRLAALAVAAWPLLA